MKYVSHISYQFPIIDTLCNYSCSCEYLELGRSKRLYTVPGSITIDMT